MPDRRSARARAAPRRLVPDPAPGSLRTPKPAAISAEPRRLMKEHGSLAGQLSEREPDHAERLAVPRLVRLNPIRHARLPDPPWDDEEEGERPRDPRSGPALEPVRSCRRRPERTRTPSRGADSAEPVRDPAGGSRRANASTTAPIAHSSAAGRPFPLPLYVMPTNAITTSQLHQSTPATGSARASELKILPSV